MKADGIKFKKVLIFYIIFILCNFLNSSTLKGMIDDEEITSISRSSNVVLLEDLHSQQDEIDSRQNSPIGSSPLSRYGTLENGSNLQNLDESEENAILTNRISKLYLAAFQKDLENGISRSEALKYIICLAGGLGPFIPQIAIAKTIGQSYDSELLGYTLIATSALTIEAITSWMIWELIDDTKSLIKAAKQDRAYSSTCNFNVLKSIGIGLSSTILGVLSSAPDVYIKYKYNNVKWFSLISLVYDSIPRVIGFYKLFSSLQLEKIKRVLKEQSIEERHGVKIVNISKVYFLQKCKENGIESVSESLSNFTSPSEIYSYLTSNTQPNLVEADSPYDFARGVPRKGIKYSSIILPIASATFNVAMAYKGFKLIVNNEPTLWLLSTFSVMPAFFLTSYVVMEASGNVFDKIYLCRSRTPSSDYFTSFRPKLNVVLLGTSLLLASATSFSTFYLISDNLEGTFLDPIKYGIAALAVGTDFTFGTFTVYSTLKRYGEVIYRKYSKGSSYVINCTNKLSDLGNSFVNFSSNFIRSFISDTISEEEN